MKRVFAGLVVVLLVVVVGCRETPEQKEHRERRERAQVMGKMLGVDGDMLLRVVEADEKREAEEKARKKD